MRIRFIIIFSCLVLSTAWATAQTADEIIGRYVAYIGGKKKWKKISTLTTSGEYNYGGIPFPFHTYAKAPNKYKFVVPFNGKYYAQAYDGAEGWKIDAFKNETIPTLLKGKDALAMANEADVELQSALINYRDKGHHASLQGKETRDGVAYFKIRFTRENGDIENYYINALTSELTIKTAVAKNVELQGALLETTYSDYRKVGGVRIPFRSVSASDGQIILTITIDKAEINVPVDEKEFHPIMNAGKL